MEGDIQSVRVSPFMLDKLYHWADDTDGAPDIELIPLTENAFIAKQGDRVRGFKELFSSMPTDDMIESFLRDNGSTSGVFWPD